ncbi:MAG TPA: amino acid ABC transporter permease [Acetobacteraceae bacterium]|jgi:polar amino acid transport system permease protein|nr:amino acid ABC transporter permease [Acetobacteraceae bacterium]
MDWGVLWEYRAALATGLGITLGVSALAIVGATVLGVLVGCLRGSGVYLLQRLTASYMELLRNLPLIVKLFFLYFVVGLPAVPSALAALVLHQSAYIADVTMAGLRSVGRGQSDAGASLGLTRWQLYRLVILPQILRVILSPMTTQYVSVIKNSSVVALIGITDLTFQTQQINVETFRGFEAATAATLLYMVVAGAVIAGMTRLQHLRGTR